MEASGSFQLDAAYTNQRPGSRRKVGRVTARSLASASLYGLHVRKIITALTASFCLTEKEFLSVPPESSALFKLHFLLVKFDTEGLFFFHNINMKAGVAWQKPRPLQRQWQNTLGLCDEYYKYINHNLRAACRFSASVRSICFSYRPQVCLCEGLSTHMLPFMILL